MRRTGLTALFFDTHTISKLMKEKCVFLDTDKYFSVSLSL